MKTGFKDEYEWIKYNRSVRDAYLDATREIDVYGITCRTSNGRSSTIYYVEDFPDLTPDKDGFISLKVLTHMTYKAREFDRDTDMKLKPFSAHYGVKEGKILYIRKDQIEKVFPAVIDVAEDKLRAEDIEAAWYGGEE